MRTTMTLAVLAGLLLLAGCEPVPSVHPLYSPDTVAFEPGLLGCWGEEAATECIVTFTQRDDERYDVTLKEDDGSESAFLAHAVKLGDELFLDLQPVRGDEAGTVHDFHYASMHTFYRVRFEEEVLHVAFLDDDWLDAALKDGSVALAHRRREGNDGHKILLTESTAGLQRFVSEYAGDDEAFTSIEPLYRLRGPAMPKE